MIRCSPKEGRRQIYTIIIDDEPWMDIHTKIFGRNPSFSFSEFPDNFKEKFFALEYSLAKKYALDCLGRRSYPIAQLKKLLTRNLVSANTIEKVIEDFIRLGYLNDNEWIQRFVKSQLAKHIGPQMILAKLRAKGISQEAAEKYLELLVNHNDSRKSIYHLLNTKYKKRNFVDFREKQKVFQALARKGFDAESILSVLHEWACDKEKNSR